MRDIKSYLSTAQTLVPRTFDTDGAVNGADVDLANYDAAVVVVDAATWATDGTYTPKVQEAPDDGTGAPGTYADVAAGDLDGTFTAVTSAATDNLIQTVGYLGSQRWIRVVMTTASNTSGTLEASAVVVRGKGRKQT